MPEKEVHMSLMKWRNMPEMPVISDLWSDFFGTDISDFLYEGKGSTPAVNVIEAKDSYRVDVAAPGMGKDNFEVKLENNVLTISGKKENTMEEEKENFRRKEFSYTSFQRSFHLPETTDTEKIQAQYKEGILCITVPKKEEIENKNNSKVIQIS